MQTTRRFFYGTNWSPAANSGQRGPWSYSQSNSRGSGPEVLKRERGHVTAETGVAEVGVFRALQPNDTRQISLPALLPKLSRNIHVSSTENSNI